MNIQQFQYVLAVVDLKNFEAAAEKCFVTQSTLSTMIARFEEEIGIKIFNRKTKPVSLTHEGEQIVERLRIVAKEVEAFKTFVQELKGEMEGEIRVGIIPTLAPYLLPLFLLKFTSAFPKLKVVVTEITTAEIVATLKNRSLDIGILATPLHDDSLVELDLFYEPFLVYDCASEKRKKTVSPEELDYAKLWLMEDEHCLAAQVKRICDLSHKKAEKKANLEFRAASIDSLLKITKANRGATIIPYLASLDLRDEDKRNLVPFANPVPARRISLVAHQHFVKKKLLKELQRIVQESVSGAIPTSKEKKVVKPL
ncbi:MAG: LysR substrate-binding domain-containing protein [Chloroherpetonaceae bacterium]|nr:LysR substrate-binding domain-containing protein [Chloroherpetonaceae bacterium]MDW8437056.1 LysR substrate-binding domain-containing protein [Chloroherpetonaceae bacterium]